jgi:hypothetical protein
LEWKEASRIAMDYTGEEQVKDSLWIQYTIYGNRTKPGTPFFQGGLEMPRSEYTYVEEKPSQ